MSQFSTASADSISLDGQPPLWSRVLVAGVFLGWLAIIWFWSVSIYTLTVDDSYYYLKTAANAASGYGFTFDQINTTNGFHPLWMLILVPLSWASGGNMEVFARMAMTLQLAMVYAGTVLLSRALEDRKRWIVLATAVLMLNFYYAKIVINALESGVQWLCMCATLAATLNLLKRKSQETDGWQFFGLGLLAGLTVLSRLTSILFAGGIVLLVIIVTWQITGSTKGPAILRRVALIVLGTVLPVCAYLAWSHALTGHFTPVSAAIKTSREVKLSSTNLIVALSLAAMWLGSGVILWRSAQYDRFFRNFVWIAFPIFTYIVLQEEADIFFRGVLVSEIWYMVPQAVLVAVIVGLFCRQAALRRGLWRATTIVGVAALLLFAAFTWSYRLDPQSYASYITARHTADWLREHTDPKAIVAGWDVGVIGAYSDRRVADLDGLINSWDYKQNYLDKNLTEKWITDNCQVDYLAQEFLPWNLTPEVLRDYRGVDLLKWKVVHQESAWVQAMSKRGQPLEVFDLILSRTGDGIPMEEFLHKLNQQPAAVPPVADTSLRLNPGSLR